MWSFVVHAKLGATAIVRCIINSTLLFICRTNVSLLTVLYEADKKAHEEAVGNGGVRAIV